MELEVVFVALEIFFTGRNLALLSEMASLLGRFREGFLLLTLDLSAGKV